MKEFLIPSIPHILTGCQDSMQQRQMHLVKTAVSFLPIMASPCPPLTSQRISKGAGVTPLAGSDSSHHWSHACPVQLEDSTYVMLWKSLRGRKTDL